jgi:hypothetical protein
MKRKFTKAQALTRMFTDMSERRTERREGIGLCDQCGQPNWPQEYVGCGCMICLDCLAQAQLGPDNAKAER